MYRYLIILLLFTALKLRANMAEPVDRGTLVGNPFTSRFVDVLHEDLHITIDSNFQHATYLIKYQIRSTKNGFQIPLLFYAKDFLDSFTVNIDGKPLKISEVPYEYREGGDSMFADFNYLFKRSDRDVIISYDEQTDQSINLDDLIYFETDITEGEHIITVTYTGLHWRDRWDWLSRYNFRYILSPAKYWKSFGSLNITIDASAFSGVIETNLGKPTKGNLKSIAEWRFNKLPTDNLMIHYNPKVGQFAETLINIGPFFMAIPIGLFLVFVHITLTYQYRKNNLEKKYSAVVIFGSLLVPLLFLIIWLYVYDFIDFIIGEDASRTHGYNFLILFLYPIIVPFYWLILWITDRQFKKKYLVDQENII